MELFEVVTKLVGPVRPTTAENTFLPQRIKAAWRVLMGTSDAIEWDYPTDSKKSGEVQP